MAHIHCKPFKRIHNSSPETLVYFFIDSIVHMKAWENKLTRDTKKIFLMYYQRESMYIKINTGKHIQCDKTTRLYTWLDHSFMHHVHEKVVWLNNFDWLEGNFHVQLGPHRQRWQTYFKMIFFLTASRLPVEKKG